MFTLENQNTKFPIKVWLDDKNQLEPDVLKQAENLANLPFIHKWVALMPDTHFGMGMPIGGVIALKNAIIPNSVGSDIGCGMGFVGTNIPVRLLTEKKTNNGNILTEIINEILQTIPVGFDRHSSEHASYVLDMARENIEKYEEDESLHKNIMAAYTQIGTLGGGNHFIELQEDEDGYLGIMVHSGSRNLGKQICDHFNYIAVHNADKYEYHVPDSFRLAYLPVDSNEGQRYINWMNLALNYAKENREKMLLKIMSIVDKWVAKNLDLDYEYDEIINCHHNYASLENHYGEDVWVHRKGATRAYEGELAVIPGSMASSSYVVMGRGNKESFCTSSHGAGRKYSRSKAKKTFEVSEVMDDLKRRDVVLGKKKIYDIAEESRFAYKNIDEVMGAQNDLVKIVKKLRPIGVVKG